MRKEGGEHAEEKGIGRGAKQRVKDGVAHQAVYSTSYTADW
jgi:hypothetical protein